MGPGRQGVSGDGAREEVGDLTCESKEVSTVRLEMCRSGEGKGVGAREGESDGDGEGATATS